MMLVELHPQFNVGACFKLKQEFNILHYVHYSKLSGEWLQLEDVLISLHNDMSYFVLVFQTLTTLVQTELFMNITSLSAQTITAVICKGVAPAYTS